MLPGKKYTVDVLLRVVWSRRWMVVLPFVVVTTATVVYSDRLPNRYRSETLIMVVPQRVPTEYVRPTVTERIEDRLPAISQQILSRTRLERIILDFNLYVGQRRAMVMEDVVALMRRDIGDIEIVSRADSFRVRYETDDSSVAMKVTERLAALFIEENLRDRELLAAGTSAFLESQLQDARRRLIEHEEKIEAYRRRHAGEMPSQLPFNLQAMQATQNQLQSVVDGINRDRDRRLLLERTIGDLTAMQPAVAVVSGQPEAVTQNASPAVQLDAVRKALRVLELRLKPEHPDVVRMKRTVANLEERVKTEAAAEADADAGAEGTQQKEGEQPTAPVSVDAARVERIRELKAEIESLDRQIAYREAEQQRLLGTAQTYQARVEAVPARESELVALTRDYETLQTLYKTLLAKREDSKLAENLERRQVGEQFKILDPARRPERPSSPDRFRINATGAFAGLALGLALVFLLDYRDASLHTESEVIQALAVSVLASIPPILTARERRGLWWRRVAWSIGAFCIVLACGAVLLFVTQRG